MASCPASTVIIVKNCPKCQLMNPDGALRCDCGYDFPSGTMQRASLAKQGEPSMRSLGVIVGIVAFTLPVLVVAIGMHLDRPPIRPADRYAALIPILLWGSIAVAALVPAAVIITSKLSWPRRIGLTVAVLCLLILECGFAFYIALLSELR